MNTPPQGFTYPPSVKPRAKKAEPKDEPPGEFKFGTGRDKDGMLQESKDYVKATCKHCYGRGFQTFLVGDGYLPGAPGARQARQARRLEACVCVHSGYNRNRRAFEKRIAADIKFEKGLRDGSGSVPAGWSPGTTEFPAPKETDEAIRLRVTEQTRIAFGCKLG